MLKEKVLKKLNDQINLEFYSSNLYLQMSAWSDKKGYEGCTAFLLDHAREEMEHMQRLFNYVNECGSMAIVGSIDAPPTEFESVSKLFQMILKHEQHVTQSINELVDLTFSEKDFSTFNFLQWYVAEQHEEEKLFQTILTRLEVIGTDGRGLYHFDQQITRYINQPDAIEE